MDIAGILKRMAGFLGKALRRHGVTAKIAFRLLARVRKLPDGTERIPDGTERIPDGSERSPGGTERIPGGEEIPDDTEAALLLPRSLAADGDCNDDGAAALRAGLVATLPGNVAPDGPEAGPAWTDGAGARLEGRAALRALARRLLADPGRAERLGSAMHAAWTRDDPAWPDRIGATRRSFRPRMKDRDRFRRGGIGVGRVRYLKAYLGFRLAFASRPMPEGALGTPMKGFMGRLREKILKIRHERNRFFAHAPVAPAPGFRGRPGARIAIERGPDPAPDGRFLPCRRIVMEDLAGIMQSRYRSRARNEEIRHISPADLMRRILRLARVPGIGAIRVNPACTSSLDSLTGGSRGSATSA
jgi:hypothetical protein